VSLDLSENFAVRFGFAQRTAKITISRWKKQISTYKYIDQT